MSDPLIARRKPILVNVEAGTQYFWCACGRSRNQPFCDGSHKGTEFRPLKWIADASGERLFCACKRTRSAPFCDGSHNSLSDTYEQAKEGDGAGASLVEYEFDADGVARAVLDNGCYVIRLPDPAFAEATTSSIYPLIGPADGAQHLSQYYACVASAASPVLRYPGSDVVLFVFSGNGVVRIGARQFAIGPESGACVKPGEAFQVRNDGSTPVCFSITVCPPCADPQRLDDMPSTFDDSYRERVQGVDESKQEAMADRFFQVLVDDKSHGTPVSQFIGEIPASRAAHHRHLYEETITVLSGEGFMWTDHTKTAVRPGDTIFLPMKQAHSLECTTPGGMRLIGLFYPSMSPAINY